MSEEMQDLIVTSLFTEENNDLITGVSSSSTGIKIYLKDGKVINLVVSNTEEE